MSGEVESLRDGTAQTEVFLTPKCVISPYEERNIQKSISSSPSTELTKEYYALVPIENNVLEKELKEQDALSNAFQTIIRTQTEDTSQNKVESRSKPTSLSLNSSHSSKTVKHSNSCDILSKYHINDTLTTKFSINNQENSLKETTSQNRNINPVPIGNNTPSKNCLNESDASKITESGFSPDSLLTDDPSSSSDYLSAAYTFSPGAGSSNYFPQLTVEDNNKIMDNIFTLSDSGCENTGVMESLSSHKDVTITDVSLTENTLHEYGPDEAGNSQEHKQNLSRDKQRDNLQTSTTSNSTQSAGIFLKNDKNGTTSNKVIAFKESSICKSSKEEKQRQNEEIVIMESSSLSSETGSWESVFPSKSDEKEACERLIVNEHQCSNGYSLTRSKEMEESHILSDKISTEFSEGIETNKKPYTSCFIDAANLAENDIATQSIVHESNITVSKKQGLSVASNPLPCSSVKLDASPNEWSESNDNDDSLEQAENKDQDYLHKDLSPTIFEMTPLSEDSLSTHNFGETKGISTAGDLTKTSGSKFEVPVASTTVPPFTPYNSILSLMDSSLKTYESEGSESDTTTVGGQLGMFSKNYNKSISLISSESSVIEENIPETDTYFSRSYTAPQKLDDMPIVSGRFEPPDDEVHQHDKQVKVSCAPTWIVNMSCSKKSNFNIDAVNLPEEKLFEDMEPVPKPYSSTDNISNRSRSSVDSDMSERSSQKFYIDLSSLPDPMPPEKKVDQDNGGEKKNIFSMFIDLGEKSTLKEMPARLSSSLNNKKASNVEIKTSKNIKNIKTAMISNDLRDVKRSLISFEKIESLCNDPNISISDIIGIPESIPETNESLFVSESIIKEDTLMKQKNGSRITSHISSNAIEEKPADNYQADLFVKLSDLDKPCPKSDISVTINEHSVLDVRMTRSIPDHNWGQQSLTSRSIEVISSFHSENALSLNRLFPHLKNEFSRSMPGSLSNRTRSPMRLGNGISTGEVDEQVSDISEISSVQSSFCRSIVGKFKIYLCRY